MKALKEMLLVTGRARDGPVQVRQHVLNDTLDRHPTCPLTTFIAAHAVSDDEQLRSRRPGELRLLVVAKARVVDND
jgi:hypothetical protein